MHVRPNILLILADDQRFDTIRALGNPAIITPNLDRLVESGCAFTHAHIPCGTSGAVCMPSRAMLHTGKTLFHLENAGNSIPADHAMLGETLRLNGYHTFGTGKWHNGCDAFNRSFSRGDEIYFGGMCDHWNVPANHYDPTGRYDKRLPLCTNPMLSKTVEQRRADHVAAGRHSSELIADAAIRFLSEHDGAKPFFAYVSFLAPHDPRVMPKQYRDLYSDDAIALPANFKKEHPFNTGALRIRDEMLAAFPRTPDEIREHIADYYAMITHLDAEVGRILKTLETQGLQDDTLIVFAGDNGLALGQHGLMGKQNCYEHSVRIPLIFAGPGVPKNTRTDAYAYLLDVFPTLCDLTGTETPGTVEGKSLVGAMTTGERPRDSLYFAYCGQQRAVKDRRHKLIEYVIDGQHTKTQLFDLQRDPWELNDLADCPGQEATIQALRAIMRRHRDAWGDEQTEFGAQFWPHVNGFQTTP